MDLAQIEARAQAARSFVHHVGGAQFSLTMPPMAEAVDSIQAMRRADPGRPQREAILALVMDALRGWQGVPLGMFLANDDATPVDFSADAALKLFAERPDLMSSITDAMAEWAAARALRIEELRKNSASTSAG